jgi:hypothetical protein
MDYRRHHDLQSIQEIRENLIALQAVVGELELRHQAEEA